MITNTQQIFAIVLSCATLLGILELVRRRKLKEEYSWLWILTGMGMVALSVWFQLVDVLTQLTGANSHVTTLFIFGLMFLLLISVHFSTVLSRVTQQVRRLTQEMAILSAERDEAVARAARAAEKEGRASADAGREEPPAALSAR
jgi:hypothetical protein